ncbi:MipA/OmpV family protein [Thalassomonas viridans]|uniref:MipA/OmpV family protein n=1 Tax=Thalassomonas viridans TaxID=137584 RepID=A0AAE9Z3P5_9GAMM|nr:MipA/OmpV family protein [Thalassomonas viridans]WDE05988.1 MipA/OmpV family protein [Thalassomonas viridans]
MLSRKLFATLFLLFLGIPVCYATETAAGEPAATEEQEEESDFSFQAMVGVSVAYDSSLLKGVHQQDADDYLNLAFLVDVYYRGFFIQSNHRRANGLWDGTSHGGEFGYQIEANEEWELDIILKNYLGGIEPGELIDKKEKNIPTLEGLENRLPGHGVAIRYSRFIDDQMYSLDLARLSMEGEESGWLLEGFYSYFIPYRNWDIYYGGALTYYSSSIVDYFYGIDQHEVSPARDLYQAGGGFRAQFEIVAQYPLSKSWSFNGTITQSFYSDSFTDSPLVDHIYTTQIMLGVLYVF